MSNALVNVGNLSRSQYLGGSAVPALMGLSPWRTPYQLFCEMMGLPVALDLEKENMFAAARDMEPVIIARAVREYGLAVTARSTPWAPNRYQDADSPYLAAEIDYEFKVTEAFRERFVDLSDVPIGTIINGESKTVIPMIAGKKFGQVETDEVPIEYFVQVQHGLAITNRQYALMTVWVSAAQMLPYIIVRDETWIKDIRDQCRAFWHDHILTGIPPEMSNLDDIKIATAGMNGRPVIADEVTARKVYDLSSIRKRMTTMKGEEDQLVFEIADYMRTCGGFALDGQPIDDSMLVFDDRTIATYKSQQRAAYTVKPAEYRVMKVKV